VAGTITYRQRIALPPGSVVIVRIIETSRSDSPVIAEQRIETDGKQVPFEFGVAYDRSKIRENSRYEVNVEIRDSSGR
ncbi:YbaY family lipoprotein, partial [Escherichia coli]|nr:YbaY family lipoprotein [Escherichia coli]